MTRRAYTPEERAEAIALAQRIGLKPASRKLGIGYTTLYCWTHPEYAELNRKAGILAKRRRVGTCVDCGTTTRYSGKSDSGVSPRCRSCADIERRFWAPESVVDAIRDFNDRYGHPPSARDWNPAMARGHFRDDIAERFYDDGCWPHTTTVLARFGAWNAAIRAAGFTPLEPGHKYVDMEVAS